MVVWTTCGEGTISVSRADNAETEIVDISGYIAGKGGDHFSDRPAGWHDGGGVGMAQKKSLALYFDTFA